MVSLEDESEVSSNSTDYGLQHAENMINSTAINDVMEASVSDIDCNEETLNSRTEELFEN